MSEMVERVALAMWRKREESMPGFTQRMEPDEIDKASGAWAFMLMMARTAIEAMRRPTEAMVEAGRAHQVHMGCETLDGEDMVAKYRVMVDVALTPDQSSPCPR